MFNGILAYPVTPFTGSPEPSIDVDVLSALIGRLIDDGAHAIAPLGSTGESAYLSDGEWKTVVDTSIAAVSKRVPVIVGSSELTTDGTIRRTEYARSAGADAVMVLPVSYWALTETEIYSHYAAISDAVDLPIMVYNNPATSGIDMSPELIVRMYETIDNVTMVKESTGDIARMQQLNKLSGGSLPFYNGSNPLVLDALREGASGWCTAAPCLAPRPCLALVESAAAGDFETAELIYDQLRPFLQFIVARGLPTTIKAGLDLLGRPAGVPRRPLLPLDTAGRTTLSQLIEDAANLSTTK
ncbi:dihydrodipicolinate synthase family protein [Nocardia farcinica]|nr:dihydrodipicolinate synthase family protein [Nocardia farcinica]